MSVGVSGDTTVMGVRGTSSVSLGTDLPVCKESIKKSFMHTGITPYTTVRNRSTVHVSCPRPVPNLVTPYWKSMSLGVMHRTRCATWSVWFSCSFKFDHVKKGMKRQNQKSPTKIFKKYFSFVDFLRLVFLHLQHLIFILCIRVGGQVYTCVDLVYTLQTSEGGDSKKKIERFLPQPPAWSDRK